MRHFALMALMGIGLCLLAGKQAVADNSDWVPIDPENEIYMDLPGGTVIIELHPEVAPGHVERIKTLARAGFYNGVIFHRVIEDFMAQSGDPTGTGEGGSSMPDLKAEFSFHAAKGLNLGADRHDDTIAVDGAAVILTEPKKMLAVRSDGKLESWMPHCRGVVSMARTDDPDSANSQFFIMFSNTHELDLDRNYSAWGRVVHGMDVVDHIERGEPPDQPTKIIRMRVGSDVPDKERIALEELSPTSQAMHDMVATLQAQSKGRFNACSIEVPVRVATKSPEATSQ